MTISTKPAFGPDAEIYVLATNARENAQWEKEPGGGGSAWDFAVEMLEKLISGAEGREPRDLSGYRKGDIVPPLYIKA